MFYLLRRSLFLQSAFGVYTLDVFYFYDIQSEWFVLSVLQSAIRGYFGRMLFKQELHEHRAITIQKMVRSYLARRRYKRVMRGIVLLQSHYRRRRAKKQLKVLKVCHTFVCILIAGLSYILDIFCILYPDKACKLINPRINWLEFFHSLSDIQYFHSFDFRLKPNQWSISKMSTKAWRTRSSSYSRDSMPRSGSSSLKISL